MAKAVWVIRWYDDPEDEEIGRAPTLWLARSRAVSADSRFKLDRIGPGHYFDTHTGIEIRKIELKENPYTPQWPRYEYRVRRVRHTRWAYSRATFHPDGKIEQTWGAGEYTWAEDATESACEDAVTMSLLNEGRNPNPVIVFDVNGRPACAYINGASVSWDELEEMGYGPYFKNPYTPPSTQWPIYEFKLSPVPRQRVWIVREIRLNSSSSNDPLHQMKLQQFLFPSRERAIEYAKHHSQYVARAQARNPNPVRLIDENGRCLYAIKNKMHPPTNDPRWGKLGQRWISDFEEVPC